MLLAGIETAVCAEIRRKMFCRLLDSIIFEAEIEVDILILLYSHCEIHEMEYIKCRYL